MSAPPKRDRRDPGGPPPTPTSAELFGRFVALLRAELSAQMAAEPRGYYSASDNPLGRRAFLAAARRKEFPSHRVGKLVLAARTDVDAWIAAHPAPAPRKAPKPAKDASPEPPPDPNFEIDQLLARNRIGPGTLTARPKSSGTLK